MSTRTPPGWYPDPGHTGFGPAPERWWDGQSWTDHTRTAPAVPGTPAGFPQQPGFPPQAPHGKSRGPVIAVIAASVAVVLAIAVGVVVIAGDDGGADRADDGPSPTASAESSPRDDTTTPDEDASPAPGQEQLAIADGVTLPVPAGWERVEGTYGAAVNTTSYTCPLKKERCVRAGAAVYVTPADGDPEAVAQADIEANATWSYGKDYYGGITSHEETESKPVRVAGQDGYLVRWKIDNKADPDAYVQSVAFPHPDGSGQMLVMRAGVDIHEDAPPVSDMDEIVAGAEKGAIVDEGSSEQV